MILFFPDVNVWVALSDGAHSQNQDAWAWLNILPHDSQVAFSRFTQIGLLRLLTNPAVMGTQTCNLRQAWAVYDRWLDDPRVQFYPEPSGLDDAFRRATVPFATQKSPNAIGDCWLLACARGLNATLVTFDRGLYALARRQGVAAMIPN